MNRLHGIINSIDVQGSLSIVIIKSAHTELKAIVIETPGSAPYLRIGSPVDLLFKETEVVLGKGPFPLISMQNKLRGTVISVEKGKLLSKISMNTDAGKIVSLITSAAVDQLNIREGEKITALIKTNEIMLSECQ